MNVDYKHTYKCVVKREALKNNAVISTVVGATQFQKIFNTSPRLLKSYRDQAYSAALKDAEQRQTSGLSYKTVLVSSEGSKVDIIPNQ